MKKLLSLALLTTLTLSQTFPAQAAFSDIRAGSDLATKVEYLNSKGIIKGYEDGTFKPTQTINRAEALKIIFEAIGSGLENDTNSGFPDVPSGEWYAKYVTTAKKKSIISGYADGKYRPNQQVNRVEFIKMAMSALPFYSTIPNADSNALEQFRDAQADQWYLPYVSAGLEMNFLSKTDRLKPNDPMQRQDAAIIVYNIAQYMENNTGASDSSGIPYVPDEAFTVLDPETENSTNPELGPEQAEVRYDGESTQIIHRLNSFELSIDEDTEVFLPENEPARTNIEFENGCMLDVYTYDSNGESVDAYYQRKMDPDNFMEEPLSTKLEKETAYAGLNVYKITSTWKTIGTVIEYFIHTDRNIYTLNAHGPNKSYQECFPLVEKALKNFTLR